VLLSRSRQYYLAAIILGLLFHGSLISYTVGNTYDAYVHMFFAEHYAQGWFETWNYKWYTGFTMTSYPPLVHQIIALLSKVVGLKMGFIIWALVAIVLFIRGVYHFSRIWVDDISAGYAALFAVLSSSYVEAIHLFGQLPSITGAALLLNACPEIYKWIRYDKWSRFFTGISIMACMTAAHHVTTIFGMVFFILPTLGVAVLDKVIKEKGGIENVRVVDFIIKTWQLKHRAILIGVTVILLVVGMIFPYWYWSKTDPITQVSIPHGSRADFLEELNLGLVFFAIPWGIMLFFLPPIFNRILRKRNIFLGLSFCLLFLLGTGGTTPLPIMILGENAFNILTLDRFTFWASIIAIPFFANLMHSLIEGHLSEFINSKLPKFVSKFIVYFLLIGIILIDALIINMSNMKPMQPDEVKIKPIVNFLSSDGHDRWRFLTLGFGDQMAWLSAHTDALSVDGNYHSARRLPELTTRAVERIENSKYLGEEGLGALRQFLSVPERYHLKYIFNNDKYYETVLSFYGWTKLKPLSNNIDVWERKDVNTLPTILPRKDIPQIQKFLWGVLPLSSLLIALILNFIYRKDKIEEDPVVINYSSNRLSYWFYLLWMIGMMALTITVIYLIQKDKNVNETPEKLLKEYFHHIDFKNYDQAYNLLEAESRISMDQFMLELSLEDGLLASYAKLDSINITQIKPLSNNISEAYITASWFTAVQKYQTQHDIILEKIENKWFIRKETFEMDITADQLISISDIDFLNQGKRQAISGSTLKEDVLDRPDIYIKQANLVVRDSLPYIVGELINVDVVPSFVNVKAILFNERDEEILNMNSSEVIKHNLLPKESTLFKIDFSEYIFEGDIECIIDSISSFAIFVNSSVTDEKLYKYYGLKNIHKKENNLQGSIVNYGNKEITIPQILIGQCNDDNITWVDHTYIDRGIRPQREKDFSYTAEGLTDTYIVKKGTDDNLLVNGNSRDRYYYTNGNKLVYDYTDKNVEYIININGFVSDGN